MNQHTAKKLTADRLSEYSDKVFKKLISLPDIIFYLIPFVLLSAWLITVIAQGQIRTPQTYYLIQYVFTYDHGYVARGLFGEVLSWFVDIVTDEIIYRSIIALDFFLVITSSLCIGKVMTKAKQTPTVFPVVVFLCIFICFLPLSFDEFFIDVKLDKLVWCITLLAVFLSGGKRSIWLVPVFCTLATVTNPVFVFISMFLIAIILLHKYFSGGFTVKNLIICILTYALIIFFSIYAIYSQQVLGFENAEEMVSFYFSRYEKPLSEEIIARFGTDWIFDYFVSFADGFKVIFSQHIYELYVGPSTVFSLLWTGAPTTVLLSRFWLKALKAESDKFQKFIYFLCILIPFATIPVSCMSWEFAKYFGHTLIVEVGLVLYFITQDIPSFKQTIKQTIAYMKANPFITTLVASYILTIIHRSPYDF